jgi:hypothetical protein
MTHTIIQLALLYWFSVVRVCGGLLTGRAVQQEQAGHSFHCISFIPTLTDVLYVSQSPFISAAFNILSSMNFEI